MYGFIVEGKSRKIKSNCLNILFWDTEYPAAALHS